MPRVRPELAHAWGVSRIEAADIQEHLAAHVKLRPMTTHGPGAPTLAAGVDVGYTKDGPHAWAAAVVMDTRWQVVSSAIAEGVPDSPYAPGYLAFREGRLTLEALCALDVKPDLIFVDGHRIGQRAEYGR
jgi:deoxyinosine 3'endonuclease (endonuclease V)